MLTWNELRAVAAAPYTYAIGYKRQSLHKLIGYFCSYAPEEIIYAADAHPFRILGTQDNIHLADAHLQSYCCSLVRGTLEAALSHRLDFLDGVVFPHTCDTIQRLSDIWRLNIGPMFHLDLVLPVRLDSESARDYLRDILNKFRAELQQRLHVDISDDRLRNAVKTYNTIRSALQKIYALRIENPTCISGRDVYTLVKASMVVDRAEMAETLPRLLQELETSKTAGDDRRKRLLLTGSVCEHPDIYDMIENAGGVVVWDDLCTGARYCAGNIAEEGDPLLAIAQRYWERMVCPAKHRDLFSRGEHIVRLARETRAAGVVFLQLKFCDPHAFDYPYIKTLLDQAKIPSLLLQIENQLPSAGQLQTRFETFVQMML